MQIDSHPIENHTNYHKKDSKKLQEMQKSMTTKMEEAEAAMNTADRKTFRGLESKTCDLCRSNHSVLFCLSDSTFLCGPCDARAHAHHPRVWLCEVCERSPSAVTCKADAAALCAACDADIHSANPLARRHERVPVVPFLDSAANNYDAGFYKNNQFKEAKDRCSFLGFEDGREDAVADYLKSADCFFLDADPYLDLEYADSVVPVQQQEMKVCDDGVAVGVLQQHLQPVVDFDFGRSNASSYSTYSVCSSEVGVVPDTIGDVSNEYMNSKSRNVQTSAMTGMDREARVMRYREKRKNRRFEKTIRYASRKAYAETRPRIKGRFVKRAEVEAEGMVVMDGGYGIVPSF